MQPGRGERAGIRLYLSRAHDPSVSADRPPGAILYFRFEASMLDPTLSLQHQQHYTITETVAYYYQLILEKTLLIRYEMFQN